MTMKMTLQVWLTLLALGGGCAAQKANLPPAQISASEGAVKAAEDAGAAKITAGAFHLKLAQDQLTEARLLMAKSDPRAEVLFNRSLADAELALALARQESAKSEAQAAEDRLREVRQGGGTGTTNSGDTDADEPGKATRRPSKMAPSGPDTTKVVPPPEAKP